jgi:SAM-dependent methyltransferase
MTAINNPGRVECPVCATTSGNPIETISISEQFRKYAHGDETVHRALLEKCVCDATAYQIFACGYCGLHFSYPLQEPGAAWYAYAYQTLGLHAGNRWEFDYVADTLKASDRVGEIGCGTGVFLEKCRNKHVDAYGIDFSAASVEECHRKGLRAGVMGVSTSNVEEATGRTTIVSYHVLEHLAEPARMFKLAHRWTDDKALLWIAVPSNHRIDRLTGEKDYLDEPPHHLTKWTPAALRLIGQKNGWEMQQVVYEPIGIRQRLWSLCVRNGLYRRLVQSRGFSTKWGERALRYLFYLPIALRHPRLIIRLSGFSMLALFKKTA